MLELFEVRTIYNVFDRVRTPKFSNGVQTCANFELFEHSFSYNALKIGVLEINVEMNMEVATISKLTYNTLFIFLNRFIKF